MREDNKTICIAIDEVGNVYGHWLAEMPRRVRNKYDYKVVSSIAEATELKDKLEKEGNNVFINYLAN